MICHDSVLSIRHQCQLLSLSRSSYYYQRVGETAENLWYMELMDSYHLEEPTAGALRMRDMLEEHGYHVNIKRVRRLMRLARISVLYPRKNLTKSGQTSYVYPYLLRHCAITQPHQVWATDISYIPMQSGFLYMTAIIDVFSRYIVGWDLSNSLSSEATLRVIRTALENYPAPQILNSDQGVQFTCAEYVDLLHSKDIAISMVGRGRCRDNAFIERFWRRLKWEYIYLHPIDNGTLLWKGIHDWIDKKYHRVRHQGTGEKPLVLFTRDTSSSP